MRRRITMTAKLTAGKDDDLIAWWEHLPSGERSVVLKRILRAFIESSPASPLRQVAADVAWLRSAFTEWATQAEQTPRPAASRQAPQNAALSDEDTRRREHKIAKTRW